jgi:hypothetical protein
MGRKRPSMAAELWVERFTLRLEVRQVLKPGGALRTSSKLRVNKPRPYKDLQRRGLLGRGLAPRGLARQGLRVKRVGLGGLVARIFGGGGHGALGRAVAGSVACAANFADGLSGIFQAVQRAFGVLVYRAYGGYQAGV